MLPSKHIFLLVFTLCLSFMFSEGKICARDKSRIVAKVVKEKVLQSLGTRRFRLTPNCKFALDRSMYAAQEQHKFMEGNHRWTCDFCGKAFVSEFFLDQHFENRHGDTIMTDDAVCLADVCDVFRCDILSGATQPDYWDIALCLEDDMEELFSQCQVLVEECMPTDLTKNETETLKGHMMEAVCSFLTCSKFWNTPFQEEESALTVLYIVLTTMTCFGIMVYNFIFYSYFYSESDTLFDPTPKTRHRIKKFKGDIRSRENLDYSRVNLEPVVR